MTAEHAPLPAGLDGLDPFPATALAALDAGLRALGLSDLDAARRDVLVDHLRLLLAWNEAINLTAIREPEAAVRAHILDALAAAPLLRNRGVTDFLDLGSGGGLPGIPLAVALPARRVVLVESVAKKARFLDAAVAALDLGRMVVVAADRAESLAGAPGQRESWPAITARAVAALPELVELAFPLLAQGGILVAWKTGPPAEERARALPAVAALGGGSIEIVPTRLAHAPRHVLVVVRKTGRTAPRWPRQPGERKRRPW